MKLSDMYPVDRDLVVKLIREKVDMNWVRDMIQGKKGIHGVGGHGDLSRAEQFMNLVWDNLKEEQQAKAIEYFNLIVEEDLFLEKQPATNYWFHLLDFAVLLEKKLPGKINSKPFLIWKETNYPNLSHPPDREHPALRELNQKIESAFLKN